MQSLTYCELQGDAAFQVAQHSKEHTKVSVIMGAAMAWERLEMPEPRDKMGQVLAQKIHKGTGTLGSKSPMPRVTLSLLLTAASPEYSIPWNTVDT